MCMPSGFYIWQTGACNELPLSCGGSVPTLLRVLWLTTSLLPQVAAVDSAVLPPSYGIELNQDGEVHYRYEGSPSS